MNNDDLKKLPFEEEFMVSAMNDESEAVLEIMPCMGEALEGRTIEELANDMVAVADEVLVDVERFTAKELSHLTHCLEKITLKLHRKKTHKMIAESVLDNKKRRRKK